MLTTMLRNKRNKQNGVFLLLFLTTSVVTIQAQNAPGKPNTAGKAQTGASRTSVQMEQAEQAEWTARLNDVKEGGGQAAGLPGLPPGRAIGLLRAIWPALTVADVKAQIAKAFAWSEHPDTVRVLALAAGDTGSHAARADYIAACADIALLLPYGADNANTQAVLRRFADRSLDDARTERLREIAAQIPTAPPEFLAGVGHSFLNHSASVREQAATAGVFAALDKRLATANGDSTVQRSILEVLWGFEWPDAMLARVILPVATTSPDEYTRNMAFRIMARAGYAPGYDAIKRRLLQEAQEPAAAKMAATAGWPLAQTVPDFGRADIIPILIGIIAADNTSNTISNVGAYGLLGLTGVNFDPSHDGNWWRLWWERNHDRLPADTRNLSIPDFPHSAAYHAPIPRDVLLDRGRYRQYCLDAMRASAQKRASVGFTDTQSVVSLHDPTLIPTLIGLIASDNTYNTVYFVGSFVLGDLTGVPYNDTHDGNWWKLWYAAHQGELPANTRDLPIPDLPHTPEYKSPLPSDLHQSPEKMRAYFLSTIRQAIADGKIQKHVFTLRALAETKDPTVILPLIEMMPPDNPAPDIATITANLSANALCALTGVNFDPAHGRAWWRQWWAEHHADVEQKIAAYHPQPTYAALKYNPDTRRHASPFVMDAGYNPPNGIVAGGQAAPEPEDIRDVPSQRIALDDDPQRVYRLVGLKAGKAAPATGYKLLVVLPGGDGSDEFRAFIRRVKKYALPDDMLIAQIIAPKWNDWQAQNLVWPTRINPFYAMKFPTEQLIEDAIADAAKRARIDPKQVYALAWSSSGPAVYTALASPRSSLRGAFVAMSVFRDTGLPDPSLLKGRRVFLYHSPQDFIKIGQAQEALTYLRAHGASAQLRQYQGGHGWTGDTYGDIRAGLDWLTQADKKP